jgi:hypothetical protein
MADDFNINGDQAAPQRTFTASYTSNGRPDTVAQLNGPGYGPQYLQGAFGAFTGVPEGDGYSLGLSEGGTDLPPDQFDLHADHISYFTFPTISADDPTQGQGFDATAEIIPPPESDPAAGLDADSGQ